MLRFQLDFEVERLNREVTDLRHSLQRIESELRGLGPESRILVPAVSNNLQSTDEVITQRLVLQDEQGRIRGILGMRGGGPQLALISDDGMVRALFAAVGNRATMELFNDAGFPGVLVRTEDSNSAVRLMDVAGAERASLSIGPDGGSLVLRDEFGHSIER